ncbi:MAG: RNA-binding S4 domain-containing protein [Firmicutes bacterium]|nr:RNA-binding S4 domain-containing protein [Bacillota bacterium]
MRLDKYLKVSRLIKRRTVANEACDAGRVEVNGKIAKAGTVVKVGDIITVQLGSGALRAEILSIQETVRKDEAKEMYRLLP